MNDTEILDYLSAQAALSEPRDVQIGRLTFTLGLRSPSPLREILANAIEAQAKREVEKALDASAQQP
jgi:hypothetical protein